MQLALTPDEAAFRDELRTFYTTKIPAEIRERTRRGEGLDRDDIATSHKILNDHGLAVPNWPVEWGGKDWTPAQHQIWLDEMQLASRAGTAELQRQDGRTGDRRVRLAGDQATLPAADGQPRHLVVPRVLRAGSRLGFGVAAHHRPA